MPNSCCRARAVSSCFGELSSPTGRAPRRASHAETYPVPHPSSTTSFPARSAGSIPTSASGTSKMPQVASVAAVAMPDRDLGERVCLYVVLKPGTTLTLDELRQSLASAGVATYKWPERLEIVDELFTTKVGKIDKKALRARYWGGATRAVN